MTTTQLADFARLLEKVRERWPDAPGLPEGYEIADDPTLGLAMFYGIVRVGDAAALALCVTTAMEIGAWWERGSLGARSSHIGFAHAYGKWACCLFDAARDENEPTCHDTLPAAALAMLRGIVGP